MKYNQHMEIGWLDCTWKKKTHSIMPILTCLRFYYSLNLMHYPLGMLENTSKLPNTGKPHIKPPTDIQRVKSFSKGLAEKLKTYNNNGTCWNLWEWNSQPTSQSPLSHK